MTSLPIILPSLGVPIACRSCGMRHVCCPVAPATAHTRACATVHPDVQTRRRLAAEEDGPAEDGDGLAPPPLLSSPLSSPRRSSSLSLSPSLTSPPPTSSMPSMGSPPCSSNSSSGSSSSSGQKSSSSSSSESSSSSSSSSSASSSSFSSSSSLSAAAASGTARAFPLPLLLSPVGAFPSAPSLDPLTFAADFVRASRTRSNSSAAIIENSILTGPPLASFATVLSRAISKVRRPDGGRISMRISVYGNTCTLPASRSSISLWSR
mmetsp:Transcript_3712/g.7968  ORF Transcript_3712/g.7968 Transcript_3712/m.7968 type:complete len:265 (+) Transcript_3712:315-1109(+)